MEEQTSSVPHIRGDEPEQGSGMLSTSKNRKTDIKILVAAVIDQPANIARQAGFSINSIVFLIMLIAGMMLYAFGFGMAKGKEQGRQERDNEIYTMIREKKANKIIGKILYVRSNRLYWSAFPAEDWR